MSSLKVTIQADGSLKVIDTDVAISGGMVSSVLKGRKLFSLSIPQSATRKTDSDQPGFDQTWVREDGIFQSLKIEKLATRGKIFQNMNVISIPPAAPHESYIGYIMELEKGTAVQSQRFNLWGNEEFSTSTYILDSDADASISPSIEFEVAKSRNPMPMRLAWKASGAKNVSHVAADFTTANGAAIGKSHGLAIPSVPTAVTNWRNMPGNGDPVLLLWIEAGFTVGRIVAPVAASADASKAVFDFNSFDDASAINLDNTTNATQAYGPSSLTIDGKVGDIYGIRIPVARAGTTVRVQFDSLTTYEDFPLLSKDYNIYASRLNGKILSIPAMSKVNIYALANSLL